MNEEVKAVQIMAAAMKQTPQSYTLLHVQCDFLRSKGENQWALRLARQAVNCAPSEFVTWEKLRDIYIDLMQYDSALLTLNSCPMFTFNGRDAHRVLAAAKVHLPFHRPIGDILPERHKTEDDDCEPALQRLPAPGLRGTWARAYGLLTRLVSQIGWDELLKVRSQVFVMEEEYRMQKTQGDIQAVLSATSANGFALRTDSNRESDLGSAVIHEDGTVVRASMDDQASIRAIIAPSPTMPPVSIPDANDEPVSAVPTIRISTESSRGNDSKEEKNEQKKSTDYNQSGDNDENEGKDEADESETTRDRKKEKGKAKETYVTDQDQDQDQDMPLANGAVQQNGVRKHDLEMPVQAAGEGEQNMNEASSGPVQEPFSFSNKRLCERWLDNLFMVLYEDLRVWTIFRAEVAHFKTQHVAYRKTGMEWEVLGDLGIRLHHKEEAKEAYQRCIDTPRYTVKPWAKLMEMYADEGDIQRCIQTAIRVAAYQYSEYTEMAYPTLIARSFFKLGQIHGHAKISFTLLSMGLPDTILKIMDSYLQYGKTFKVEGSAF